MSWLLQRLTRVKQPTKHKHDWIYDPNLRVEQPHDCGYKRCFCWMMRCTECTQTRVRREGVGRVWL